MRLIDILNKIANGELKYNTKIIWDEREYTYKGDNEVYRKMGNIEIDLWNDMCMDDLESECELIEPNDFPDVGNTLEPTDNTTEKIEEVSAWGRTTFEYGSPVPADWVVANKLNEIIRYINK